MMIGRRIKMIEQLIERYLNENQDIEVSGVYGKRLDTFLDKSGIKFDYQSKKYIIYDLDNRMVDKVVDTIKDISKSTRDADEREVRIRVKGRNFSLDDFK